MSPPPFITNAQYVAGIEQQEDETWIWARKSLAFWDETWAGGHFQLIRRILKQNILGENWDLKLGIMSINIFLFPWK